MRNDPGFTINMVASAELRKRGSSRLWYRQTDEEPQVDVPPSYVSRSTSLLAPEVRPVAQPSGQTSTVR
ncbi:MAG: hypothetical protein M3Y37_10745 [Chloroflexota bacterium]|nr:hypothetical protein [Chloroflexota bacterium]